MLGLGLGLGLGFRCSVVAWAVGGTREKPRERSDESMSHAAHLVRVRARVGVKGEW